MPIQLANTVDISLSNVTFGKNKKQVSDNSKKNADYVNRDIPTGVKAGVFATTLAGVSLVMALVLKGKGYNLNPLKILKTPPKEWGIFKVTYDAEKHEIEKLVGALALGSVGGGLLGGALFDKKENLEAKFREAIIQVVGNIATPLLVVSTAMRIFNKQEPKILNSMKFLKGKFTLIPSVIASAVSLFGGILLGNKIGNTINQKAFNVNNNRKVKMTDLSPHIDDLCLVISLVAAQSKIGPYITRLIPAALMVAGISTGLAPEQEKIKHNRHIFLKSDNEVKIKI